MLINTDDYAQYCFAGANPDGEAKGKTALEVGMEGQRSSLLTLAAAIICKTCPDTDNNTLAKTIMIVTAKCIEMKDMLIDMPEKLDTVINAEHVF